VLRFHATGDVDVVSGTGLGDDAGLALFALSQSAAINRKTYVPLAVGRVERSRLPSI
jgi:hypothetical protein